MIPQLLTTGPTRTRDVRTKVEKELYAASTFYVRCMHMHQVVPNTVARTKVTRNV